MARPKRAGHMEDEGSSTGRWTTEEHQLFEDGLRKYGKQWKRIAEEIPTRTVVQIRTHAQKYFLKLAKIEPATSTSIALKPPAHHNRDRDRDNHHAGAGGIGVGHDLPLSLTRKKRASKSTYRRRSGGESDPDEMESEQGKGAGAGEWGPEGEDDEEDAESWLTADDARHSYRSTKQTSSGRISRPPRKNAPGSPTITPRGPSIRGKASAAAAACALTAATPTARGPHGASRASAPSGTAGTTGVWGGAGPLSGLTVTIPPPRADGMGAAAAVGSGGMSPAGPYYLGGAAGAGKGLLACQTTSQTPTSVAELYPEVGGGPYGGKLQAHRHSFHHHHHHHHHEAAAAAVSGSSSATSSAASSLSPGRERQLLLSPVEALEYGGEDEGKDEDDLAFSKLEALAGRAAPEWAEALNKALGTLEGGGVAANGQPHEHEELYAAAAAASHYHQHLHQHHGVGPAYLALSHAHAHAHVHVPGAYPAAERAGRAGVGRHGSVGSLTDSQAGSSATSSYLPSDSDAGTNSIGSEAAVPGGKDSGHFLALVDEHEHEDDLLHQAAKRARLLGPPAPPTGAVPTAAAAFGVGKDGAAGGGGGAAPAAVAASSVVEQEEDYGYFTTEEELDQMLLGMLSHGPGGGVSAVGDARSWALDD